MKALSLALFLASLFAPFESLSASVLIGNGGSIQLGDGSLSLAGTELIVDGELFVDNGAVDEAGAVNINGLLDGGNGEIGVVGDWVNAGQFLAASGRVLFFDDVGGVAQISGPSIFNELSIISPAGGRFVLESGVAQRVNTALTIQGVSGFPVQIESSNLPQIAELILSPSGSQDIAFVGVSNVHATGQPLAPDEVNQGGSGNDFGWFGSGLLIPVDTLSSIGLLIMILTFLSVAVLQRRQ